MSLNKKGRPFKNSVKRDKRLEIRLTADERLKIEQVSKKVNLSKADTILKAINMLDRSIK